MRSVRIALCAVALVCMRFVSAGDIVSSQLQVMGDAAMTSIAAQRTFAGVLPSIADYSQTAHSVLKNGEYCPVESLEGASYCQPGAKWVMWDTPFMQFDEKDAHGARSGWDMDMNGFGTGIGRMLNDTSVIGLALGWDARKSRTIDPDGAEYSGKDRSDAFHAALYGGAAIGCFFVDAYAGFSQTWHRTRTDAEDERATAKYDDAIYSAGAKASYVWILENEMRITSSLGLEYSHLSRAGDKYDFSGTAAMAKKATHNSWQMPVAVAFNKTFESDFLTFGGEPSWWTPEVRAGYVPQFGDKRFSWKAEYDKKVQKDASFEYASYGTVGAGMKIKLRDKYIFAVDYDYRFGRDYGSHLVTGTYGVSF